MREEDLEKLRIAQRSIKYAKDNLVKTIYKQAILEGVAVKLDDVKDIIKGKDVSDVTSTDVMKVINLKHAWEFILDENVILSPTNYSLLCEVNKMIEEGFYYSAGKIRSVPVKMGGTTWIPDLPIESVIKEDLDIILNKDISDVEKGIEILLYVMKKQIFVDGNKRTAAIFANHYLISKGMGIIVIPAEMTSEFKDLLISYYEGKNEKEIKKFIMDICYMSI